MVNPRNAVCFLAAFLIASAPLALAQGTYTQIDYPGAVATQCWGIDSAGDVTGSYEFIDNLWHGFLLSGGTYIPIDYPGAKETYLFGINDLGQIVGDATGSIGFLYDVRTQTFTEISYPGASFTEPTSTNNAGTIAGSIDFQGVWEGFELIGGTCKNIPLPPGARDADVQGISASGKLVIDVNYRSSNITSYLFHHRRYRQLTVPSPSRYVLGINGAGNVLVGVYVPSTQNAGFLFRKGSFQTLSFPASISTFANGINDAGKVVGWFNDQRFDLHCYTWTPPADAAKK